jgi:class 3 adenylate cyclase
LSAYADRFAENLIDLSVLPYLTEQDLKELGVVLGDRRKMRRAIAELAGGPPAASRSQAQRDDADRRQLTVMFCDIVGSTALSGKARSGGLMRHYRRLSSLLHAAGAVQMLSSGINALRSMGAKLWEPLFLALLARAYAELGQYAEAERHIGKAMTEADVSKEKWCEAEIYRLAGEIALLARPHEIASAQAFFERALAIGREQQAKSWELRAAMSLARLWRDQGKRQQAHDLFAPVYGWFKEGFDTRDLQEAKALLDELSAQVLQTTRA